MCEFEVDWKRTSDIWINKNQGSDQSNGNLYPESEENLKIQKL